jgi:hypothetical protein
LTSGERGFPQFEQNFALEDDGWSIKNSFFNNSNRKEDAGDFSGSAFNSSP